MRLHSARIEQVTAADALRRAADELRSDRTIVMVLSASDALLARLEDGRPTTPWGLVDLATAYELRAWDGQREVRWVHDVAGLGTAWYVGLDSEPRGGWDRAATVELRDVLPTSYQLWGSVTENRSGWVTVGERRVRRFDVPFDAPEGSRLELRATELVAVLADGNARVIDELLGDLVEVAR